MFDWIVYSAEVLAASALISVVFTKIAVFIIPRLNIMDEPNERKIHTKPIPRMGGAAFSAAFLLTLVCSVYLLSDIIQQQTSLFTPSKHALKGLVIGCTGAMIIGVLDDIFSINAIFKLTGLFILTYIVSHYGVIINFPFPYAVNLILTMIWVAGMTSAINALDHMDGLSGGICMIAAAVFFTVSLQTNQFFWGLVSIAMVGSLAGYLVFNWHPAKIFMGDSGSFFLGFTLAAMSVMGGWSTSPVKAAIIPLAVLSLPIYDLIYVLVSRHLNGTTKTLKEAVVYCGKDHIGHRIQKLGFSIPNTVRLIWLISAAIALGAVVIRQTNLLESIFLFSQIILFYIIVLIFMNKKL